MPSRRRPAPPADPGVLAAARGPLEEIAVIVEIWGGQSRTAGTAARIDDLAVRYATRLAALGVTSILRATSDHCDQFVWAPTKRGKPPSVHTVHLRRTALHAIYRTLGELDPTAPDPTRTVDLPPKPPMGTRPVTDNEITLIRTAALTRTRGGWRAAAAVALAEATATTHEIPQVRWEDLDHPNVQLPGASPVQARIGTLTTWGSGVLNQCQDRNGFVIPRRRDDPDPHVAQASMSNLLARVLIDAGLHDPAVKPSSIRLWAARQHLDRHGIEAAARSLGYDSLDRTAIALGHVWQQPPGATLDPLELHRAP